MGEEGEKGGAPWKGKSAPGREEEGSEVSKGGRSGAPWKGKGAARRMEEEFVGSTEEESGVVLWTNSATKRRVMGVGMARSRGYRHVPEVPKMWRRRVPCGR